MHTPTSRTVSLTCHDGSIVSAVWFPGAGSSPDVALLVHEFAEDTHTLRTISGRLAQAGISVFALECSPETLPDGVSVALLQDAVDYLAEHHQAPQLLIGHGRAGSMALFVAETFESLQACVTIAAPYGEDALPSNAHALRQANNYANLPMHIAGLSRAGVALLVMHAATDNVYSIDNAREIFQHAKHPKSFVSLADADHALSDPAQADYAARVIVAWAQPYLHTSNLKASKALPQAQAKAVIARTAQGYTTDVVSQHHHLISDEPEDVGGNDQGPTPFELLQGALAACTSITVRMYADRKGWDLQAVEAHVGLETRSNDAGEKVKHFTIGLQLEGALDEAQRERLRDISTRCPVHRTLAGAMTFETVLQDG